MTRRQQGDGPATPRLPRAVDGALRRLCVGVERAGGRWLVDGEGVGAMGSTLAEALYARWYTRPANAHPPPTAAQEIGRASLVAALRAGHAGATRLLDGWVAVSADPDGTLIASDGSRQRSLRAGEYVNAARPGVPPAPGESVRLVMRIDHLDPERGLWWTFGDTAPRTFEARIYLNVRSTTAARALNVLTDVLIDRGIAFQLKCPSLAVGLARVDAMVLYHPREARDDLVAALLARWEDLGPLLDPAVPPLTRPVRPGLSWADDPGGERSFGQSRCEALAESLEGSGARWSRSRPDERLAILVEGLRSAGIAPTRPWQVRRRADP